MKKVLAFLLTVFLWGTWGIKANAQTMDGVIQAGLGIGAGWNPPVRFDVDLSGEYFFNDSFSLGIDFDVFVRGKPSYNFLAFGRYHFQVFNQPRFSPYLGLGVGGLVSSSGRGWFDLMAPEFGFLYEITPHLLLGPNMSFHLLAGSTTEWDFQTLVQFVFRF